MLYKTSIEDMATPVSPVDPVAEKAKVPRKKSISRKKLKLVVPPVCDFGSGETIKTTETTETETPETETAETTGTTDEVKEEKVFN